MKKKKLIMWIVVWMFVGGFAVVANEIANNMLLANDWIRCFQ
jgi:hypothetical protein